MIRTCAGCGLELLIGMKHYAHLVDGWVPIRQKGVNEVKLPRYDGTFMCELCLVKRDAGEQMALFDLDDSDA